MFPLSTFGLLVVTGLVLSACLVSSWFILAIFGLAIVTAVLEA